MSEFVLNLPTKRREYTQTCLLCREDYKTSHRQQRYCGEKREYLDHQCKPLTAKQIRAGITDEVRRGEAEAVPDPTYGKIRRGKPRGLKSEKESFGSSKNWLSIPL